MTKDFEKISKAAQEYYAKKTDPLCLEPVNLRDIAVKYNLSKTDIWQAYKKLVLNGNAHPNLCYINPALFFEAAVKKSIIPYSKDKEILLKEGLAILEKIRTATSLIGLSPNTIAASTFYVTAHLFGIGEGFPKYDWSIAAVAHLFNIGEQSIQSNHKKVLALIRS